MQVMLSSFKAGLSKVMKSKQTGTEKLASKATQGMYTTAAITL